MYGGGYVSTLVVGVCVGTGKGMFGGLHIINPLLVQFLIQDTKSAPPLLFRFFNLLPKQSLLGQQ
jgi:ABC-type microcin C transport system permease subunit YejE